MMRSYPKVCSLFTVILFQCVTFRCNIPVHTGLASAAVEQQQHSEPEGQHVVFGPGACVDARWPGDPYGWHGGLMVQLFANGTHEVVIDDGDRSSAVRHVCARSFLVAMPAVRCAAAPRRGGRIQWRDVCSRGGDASCSICSDAGVSDSGAARYAAPARAEAARWGWQVQKEERCRRLWRASIYAAAHQMDGWLRRAIHVGTAALYSDIQVLAKESTDPVAAFGVLGNHVVFEPHCFKYIHARRG